MLKQQKELQQRSTSEDSPRVQIRQKLALMDYVMRLIAEMTSITVTVTVIQVYTDDGVRAYNAGQPICAIKS